MLEFVHVSASKACLRASSCPLKTERVLLAFMVEQMVSAMDDLDRRDSLVEAAARANSLHNVSEFGKMLSRFCKPQIPQLNRAFVEQ